MGTGIAYRYHMLSVADCVVRLLRENMVAGAASRRPLMTAGPPAATDYMQQPISWDSIKGGGPTRELMRSFEER